MYFYIYERGYKRWSTFEGLHYSCVMAYDSVLRYQDDAGLNMHGHALPSLQALQFAFFICIYTVKLSYIFGIYGYIFELPP